MLTVTEVEMGRDRHPDVWQQPQPFAGINESNWALNTDIDKKPFVKCP